MKFIVSWGRDDFVTPAGNENGTGTGRDTAAEKDGKAVPEGTEGIGAHGGALSRFPICLRQQIPSRANLARQHM